MALFAVSVPSCFLLIYFGLGQLFHSILASMSDKVYQTEWHRYPRSLKYSVLFMIKRSQKPFYLSAFGMMALNLENFVTVSNEFLRARPVILVEN